MPNLTLNEKN